MKTLKNIAIACSMFLIPFAATGQQSNRWFLEEEGYISWSPQKNECHQDHIEMTI